MVALFLSLPGLGFTDLAGTTSLVTNIRVGQSPDYIRVVFDLDRQAVYEHQRVTNPNRATIMIRDVVLGQDAQQAIVNGGIPYPMRIYSWKGDWVRIDLDLDVMGTFRILNLDNPYRLVVDLYDVTERRALGASKSQASPKADASALDPDPTPVRLLTEEERRADRVIRTIVIDPGHGGKDAGASVRKAKIEEKDLVLDIALRLRRIMVNRHDATVYMTRETDVFVELEDRVAFANAKKADLFVSIHVNAHSSSKIEGLEVYMFGEAEDQRALEVAARENGTSLDAAEDIDIVSLILAEKRLEKQIKDSQNLAWATRTAMSRRLGAKYNLADLGVKTAPFYVLRYTAMPGILAEVAYLTNSKDRKRLTSSKFRQQVAESIFTGISEYIELLHVASG
ncbi:MAG TPA: N-acetylmuramoyl-L-alanine amidase [Nitrospirales bacterium]|nr:N-acetylmuramoyl-L-alanine amidase [Nitrospirales bacterium]